METIGEIIVIFMELDHDPDAPEYFEVFIKYLEAAVSEDLFQRLQQKIKEILNKGQDKMSSLLENVLEDIINKKLREVREEGKKEGLEEGKMEILRETVIRMISIGIDNEIISRVSGFTGKDCQRIQFDTDYYAKREKDA
jgi:hypothetical protein